MDYKKITLDNGLRVVHAPLKNTKTVTILAIVGTGSKYESQPQRGISHFLEHMFFKGTKRRPAALDIAEELDGVGGSYNAFTSKEMTGYWAKVASQHFDLALDVVSDILLNSTFPKEEIEKEKGVIIEELNMYLDTPLYHIQNLFEQVIFGNQPAGWDTIGTKETVLSFTRENFLEYFQSQYVSKNTVIIISGNISEDKAITMVKEKLKEINTNQFKDKKVIKLTQKEPQILLENKKTDQTHLCLGVKGFSISDDKRIPLKVLSVILGGNMSSRLFTNLREKHGMAYYIKSMSENYTDSGYLVVQAGIPNNKQEKAIQLILQDFKKITEEQVSGKELTKAKEYLKGKTLLNLEASDEIASYIAEQEILTQEVITPKDLFAKIDRVTVVEVQGIAREIFTDSGLNLALIGPSKSPESFKKILKI